MTTTVTPLQLRPCRCGHLPTHHEHFRAGADCGSCGCPRFRPVRWWDKIIFWRQS